MSWQEILRKSNGLRGPYVSHCHSAVFARLRLLGCVCSVVFARLCLLGHFHSVVFTRLCLRTQLEKDPHQVNRTKETMGLNKDTHYTYRHVSNINRNSHWCWRRHVTIQTWWHVPHQTNRTKQNTTYVYMKTLVIDYTCWVCSLIKGSNLFAQISWYFGRRGRRILCICRKQIWSTMQLFKSIPNMYHK